MTLQDKRYVYKAGTQLSIKMTTGGAVKEGAPLKLSAGTVVVFAAANDNVFGIAEGDAASGATVGVNIGWGSIWRAINSSGGALAVGDILFAAVSGNNFTVTKDGATGQPTAACLPLGICVVGGADAAEVQFAFTPQLAFNTSTGVLTLGAA